MARELLPPELAELARRPLTVAYAALMCPHLSFTIGKELDYPTSPELHARLERIQALARRPRAPAAREQLLRELVDLRIRGLLTNGEAAIARTLNPLLHPLNLSHIGRLAAA